MLILWLGGCRGSVLLAELLFGLLNIYIYIYIYIYAAVGLYRGTFPAGSVSNFV